MDLNGDQVSLTLGGNSLDWKAVAVTANPSILETIVTSGSQTESIIAKPEDDITDITAMNIGEGFAGLIQDVIIYDRVFEDFTLPTIVPAFLPQCYCPLNSSVFDNEVCIEQDDQKPVERYNG